MEYYRTEDGEELYAFSYEPQLDGNIRIYIDNQPDYRGHSSSLHATHRLPDGSRYYICYEGQIRSMEQARAVAATWADNTQRYIKSGLRFE